MQIVIDTIDPEGKCRALVVEALRCDGETLFVRKGTCDLEVSVASIVDWTPIDDEASHSLPLDRWITRRGDVVCF